MSLHDLVANIISGVNPMMQCQWYQYTTTTTAIGGSRTPNYNTPVVIKAQVQQLSAADLKHMNDMNMSGVTRKIWSDTILNGIDRAAQLGGDKIVLPDGTIWLVVQVVETWPDWCSALLQKQVSL
jgi:hypothetical protein